MSTTPPITGNEDLDFYLYNLESNLNNVQAVDNNSAYNSVTGEITDTEGNVVGYLYRYISVKYADDNVGTNLSNVPLNKFYFGVRNNDLNTESTNPADYRWYAVDGGFGSSRSLFYKTTGGRTIRFSADTAAEDYTWLVDPGTAIDLDIIVPIKTISFNEIMDNTIKELNIANSAVTAAKTNIAAIEPSTGFLIANSVGATQITDDAISSQKIQANAIVAGKIAANAVTASTIESGSVTAVKIAASSVTADKISVSQLSSISANIGSITAGDIIGINITGANITATSGTGGSLVVSGPLGVIFSAYASGTTVGYRQLNGYNIDAGNLADPAAAVVKGTTIGTSSASALQGIGNSAGHGVNGINTTYSAEGYVGSSLGGGYDFYAYGSAANYGSFTGAHDCLLPLDHSVEVGDLVYDVEVVSRKGYSNTITKVASTTMPNQKAVVGVLIKISDVINEAHCPAAFKETSSTTDAEGNVETTTEYTLGDAANNYYWCVVNSIGEGQINVCGEGGNIEAGDLIVSSSIKGKGMKQADDIVRGYTVAKARESVTFDSPTEIKQIACIYLAG